MGTKQISETGHVRDKRNGKWWWCHNAVIDQYGPLLGPHGLAVYAALCRYANDEGACWPSIAKIAQDTGMSPNRVRRSLADLEKNTLISIERRANGEVNLTSIYTLLDVEECLTSRTTTSPHAVPTSRGEVPLLHDVKEGTSPREAKEDSEKKTQSEKDSGKRRAATAAPPPPSEPVPFEAIQAAPPEARKPNPQQAEVGAWSAVMELDIHIPANAKRVGNMLTGLRKSKDCQPTADVATWRFGRTPPPDGSWNFYTHTWQGAKGQPPTEREINAYWGAWLRPALKVVPNGGDQPRAAPPSRTERNRQLLEEALRDATGQPPISGPVIEGRVIHGRAS